MRGTNADLNLLETLMKYTPPNLELQWEHALLQERKAINYWVCAHDTVQATTLFRQAIAEKKAVLSETEPSDPKYDKRIISLGKTLYCFSRLFQDERDYISSEELLNELVQTLRPLQFRRTSPTVGVLLQNSYRILTEIVPWCTMSGV